MVYYLTVEELKERIPFVYKEKVRVSGTVVPGSIKKDIDGSLEFKISDGKQSIDVRYKGIVPDIFREGVQAVVEGLYTPENIFQAKVLLQSARQNTSLQILLIKGRIPELVC